MSGINISARAGKTEITVTLAGKHDEVSIDFRITTEEANKLIAVLKQEINRLKGIDDGD